MTGLWHRLVCVTLNRNAIRETVHGALGYRCGCGLWRPVVRRSDAERSKVVRPAHERLKARPRALNLVRRRA